MKRQQSDIALSIMVTGQKQIQTTGDIIGTEQGSKKSS
jgi:tRNA threonylcarbamoyladenosine modification (KEOPS) complex Cgi121 subunit